MLSLIPDSLLVPVFLSLSFCLSMSILLSPTVSQCLSEWSASEVYIYLFCMGVSYFAASFLLNSKLMLSIVCHSYPPLKYLLFYKTHDSYEYIQVTSKLLKIHNIGTYVLENTDTQLQNLPTITLCSSGEKNHYHYNKSLK